jgi:hypothetical protein
MYGLGSGELDLRAGIQTTAADTADPVDLLPFHFLPPFQLHIQHQLNTDHLRYAVEFS